MRILLAALIVLAAQTCGQKDNGSEKNKKNARPQKSGTYTGVLPCSDCLGISTTFTIDSEGNYQRQLKFLGKKNRKANDSGKVEPGSERAIKISAEPAMTLRPADGGWQVTRLSGVSRGLPAMLKPQGAMETGRTGEYFEGHGNEPFWQLKIAPGKKIKIGVLDGDSATLPYAEPMRKEGGSNLHYQLKSKKNRLTIDLTRENCTDDMSGAQFTHSVKVEFNGRKLHGCGRFALNRPPYGSYSLLELNGKPVPDSLQKGPPYMRLQPVGNKVSGNTSCNQFTTSYQVDSYGHLSFKTPIAMTKMLCPGDYENKFTAAMKRVSGFSLAADTLELRNDGQVIMRWKTEANRDKKGKK